MPDWTSRGTEGTHLPGNRLCWAPSTGSDAHLTWKHPSRCAWEPRPSQADVTCGEAAQVDPLPGLRAECAQHRAEETLPSRRQGTALCPPMSSVEAHRGLRTGWPCGSLAPRPTLSAFQVTRLLARQAAPPSRAQPRGQRLLRLSAHSEAICSHIPPEISFWTVPPTSTSFSFQSVQVEQPGSILQALALTDLRRLTTPSC